MENNEQFNKLLSDIVRYYYNLRGGQKLTTIEEAIGVSHTVISRIENGRYPCLNLHTLQKLSDYY